jgi:CHAD domain-containing protein
MCALRGKALDWSDPEGVHDMRVSSRRLRGALRDFMPYLRKRQLADVLDQIKILADALGAVRDQDVAILGLQKLAASAPIGPAAMVDQLLVSREGIRKQARRDLQRALQTTRLKQLQKDFVAAIDTATMPKSRKSSAHAVISYRKVARRIILERLEEVEKLSAGMYQPLKMKPLHRMRISAKRLRYAIELFESCWGSEVGTFAKPVASLQSSLGELHDADIWLETFGHHLDHIEKQPKEQRTAALWLLDHFVRLHAKHLRSTLVKWSDWEAKDTGSQLRNAIEPAAEAPPTEPDQHDDSQSGES